MKNNKGFSAVLVLLSILVVTAIGFTGYYVWDKQTSRNNANEFAESQPNQTIQKNTDNLGDKEALNQEICTNNQETCISYPSPWEAQAKTINDSNAYPEPVEKITINNPSTGSYLSYDSYIDGLGSVCMDGDLETNVVSVSPKSDSPGAYVVTTDNIDGTFSVFILNSTEDFTPSVGLSLSCAYTFNGVNQNKTNQSNHRLVGVSKNQSDNKTLEGVINSFNSSH